MRAMDALRLRPLLAAALERVVFQQWDGPRGYVLFIPGYFAFATIAEAEAAIERAKKGRARGLRGRAAAGETDWRTP